MAVPVHDITSPEHLLRHQMGAMMMLEQFPSGSKTAIFTPGQLARLEVLTRGSDDPVDQGMRLLLDLDDLVPEGVSAGQTGSC